MADRHPDNSSQAEEPPGPPQWAVLAAFREACEESGVTLEQVARGSGLGGLVAGWDQGSHMLLSDIAALCGALDVRASALVTRAEALAEDEGQR